YSELTREDDLVRNETKQYVYDNYGNILSKKSYEYNTTNLIKEDKYEYNDSSWQDLLTKFNNELITYDEIGNTTSIGNKKLTWMNGRELSSYSDGTNNISYKYNLNGIRTSKIVNGIKTNYILEGTSIIFEDRNGDVIYYIYNGSELLGFVYKSKTYYYHKNMFGDIIGILDSNYNEIVKYSYDSWGALVNITDNSNINLGAINPFRYRSYYYDEETQLYYLNSRYYNPQIGRFINVDGEMSGVGDNLRGYNLFEYTFNNPISLIDEDGDWPKLKNIVTKIAKAAVVVAAIGGTAIAAATLSGPAGVVAGAAFVGTIIGTVVGGTKGIVDAKKNGTDVVDGFLTGAAVGSVTGGATGAVVSTVGIKLGVVEVVGSAQATGTALHQFASNVAAGSMTLQPWKYDKVVLNRSLNTAGLVGRKMPDVIGVTRFGNNKLVEVVSSSQTAQQMHDKLNWIIANGNPDSDKIVIDWARIISNWFK
ncbi:MAG: hypothetical protein K2H20_00135, partial [Bacilli bacterium]|nr:hypothetical protein [Bacilli bacterium]